MALSESPVYFGIADDELAQLTTLSSFESELLSTLLGVFMTGLVVHKIKQKTEEGDVIDRTTRAGKTTDKFIQAAGRGHFNGDKLISLRLLGPSLEYIKEYLPQILTQDNDECSITSKIFQLLVWRCFAVGNVKHLEELTFDKPPTTREIAAIITGWISVRKLCMGVYGNLMIEKHKIEEMVEKLAELAEHLSSELQEQGVRTFDVLYRYIVSCAIPSIPKGGILVWLICSDLSEYRVCEPPTVNDLAVHVDFAKTSGPKKALELVHEWAPGGELSSIREVLTNIMDIIDFPPQDLPGLRNILDSCEAAQGRKLNVVDLEHGLCKITRMWKMKD